MPVPGQAWRLARRSVNLAGAPCIMGVLNITPDSFSDGGSFLEIDRAVDRAVQMEGEGADIIDIGGESSRPFAEPLPEADELSRVIPVIEQLVHRLSVPISIDTYKSGVARAALASGAEIVNDISAMTFDPGMASVVAKYEAGVVLMHTRGRPTEMQTDTAYNDIVAELLSYFTDALGRAEMAGISRDRVVLDPGIGFGKDIHGNLEILRRLREFAVLDLPLLAGTSRKRFIGTVLDRGVQERLFGTAATVAAAVLNGAAVVRVHDVSQMRDVAVMAQAIRDGYTPPHNA
ncbi:dihydropteroate synthase [Geobacter sp. OR-1]|uniref:dihydropteroate synthase n=1 Tax=Geobacter sp. OR-1 TaxID=1266765 RepID=UPI0005427CF2|nr:dihydropteroate synthase [Geobacter sp. OR-1]GAM11360.1 dihydropteroate synthase [Geobacter sp. OR-1]